MLEPLSSFSAVRNLLLGLLLDFFICIIVYKSSPRTLVGSAVFRKARLLSVLTVGVLVLIASVYLTHSQFQLRTLLYIGCSGAFAAVAMLFSTISVSSRQHSGENVAKASGLFLFYGIAIGCAVASLSVVAITVGTNPLNGFGGIGVVSPAIYRADIQLRGTTVNHESLSQQFTTSSGQVNFGCEQSVQSQTTFALPPTATLIGQPSARWANTDNVSRMNATASLNGNLVVATGTITGIAYQNILFGVKNCPGGGHGELVLSGEYRTDRVSEVDAKPIEFVSTVSAATNKEDWITLPAPQEFKIRDIAITIKTDKGVTAAQLVLSAVEPYKSEGGFSALYSPQRQNGQLLIHVQ